MANRYIVNVLKNEGATIVTLAKAYFVEFTPPRLKLRLGEGDAGSLQGLRNRAAVGEVLTFQLERCEGGPWISPPFQARIIVPGVRSSEFELELLDAAHSHELARLLYIVNRGQ